jgi:hypothetical protein
MTIELRVPQLILPRQNSETILVLAERWNRFAQAHQTWAEPAKRCVDFVEGRQWTAAQLAMFQRYGRPHLQFNKLAPLIRLVLGYAANNRTEGKHLPSNDALSSDEVAELLTNLEKEVEERCELEFVDGEVMMDGIIGGRGFHETTIDFTNNDLGEITTKAADPFATYLDPDGQNYDIEDNCAVIKSRYVSVDEIEANWGPQAGELVRPYINGQTPISPLHYHDENEITPIRTWGQREDYNTQYWDNFYGNMGDFCDPYRKNIRIIDTQYKITKMMPHFIDLQTGDKQTIPEHWDPERIKKVLYFASTKGEKVTVEWRPVRRVRRTVIAGDVILFDAWSPFPFYTITGYFPWFRRGYVQGMVKDLIDPQTEVNKRRNAEMEIVSKSANSGWQYHKDSLSPAEKERLKIEGAMPGYNQEWKGDQAPKRIDPGVAPTAMDKLEQKASDDLRTISGINESALGELDRVQSGRAIEARQKQAVISIQGYLSNFKRSKKLLYGKHLVGFQRFYTEPRIYKITGKDGKRVAFMINQQQFGMPNTASEILNDITVGRYITNISERPLSESFLSAQYEELLAIIERLQPSIPNIGLLLADQLIDVSTMPNKDEIKRRINQIQTLAGIVPGQGVILGPDGMPMPGSVSSSLTPPPAPIQPQPMMPTASGSAQPQPEQGQMA